jgi:predicted DCC family thiol-disulfide oxidoreductase YuxK
MLDSEHKYILFYDGTCGFCHRVVILANKWLKKDSEVYFATLQGQKAEELKQKFSTFPTSVDSIVFYDDKKQKIYLASKAFFILCKHFRWPWKFFAAFYIVPNFISDFFYYLIAKKRYKLFGRKDACEIPDKKFRERFIIE